MKTYKVKNDIDYEHCVRFFNFNVFLNKQH